MLMQANRRRAYGGLLTAACLAPLVLTAGCAAFPTMTTGAGAPDRPSAGSLENTSDPTNSAGESGATRRQPGRLSIPGAAPATPSRLPATPAQIDALLSDEMVDATLAPQTVPQFVASVFGGVLNLPYTLAGDTAGRPEIIAGGTGGQISKRALFRLTQQALKQYNIDVFIEGGAVTVGNSDTSALGSTVSRNRTTPTSAGRVVQFFPVQTIEVNTLQPLLTDLFPNLSGVRVSPDVSSNSLVLSGSGRDVAQLVRVLRELDQPRFSGSQVLRVEPVYWAADGFAKSLEDVLKTEGFIVSSNPAITRAITILAFPSANQVLIFAKDPEALARAEYWATTLDQPAALGDKATTFVYQVQNTDAASLGSLAMGQSPTVNTIQAPVGVPGTAPAGGVQARSDNASMSGSTGGANGQNGAGSSGKFMNGQILTDPIGNRILFTGTASEYAQLRTLLATLDSPAPQVVIEVMIAEVTLTDATSLGVNLFGTDTLGEGTISGGTNGLDIGAGALSFTFVGPNYRASLVANASNNKVNILQRPQLVMRSGGSARFQVGTDVPIITSQSASGSQSGGSTDILQSVQYRQTGTILEIKPVVYGDRVDMQISQELSSAGDSPSGISSPIILNRSLSTQIAVRDGWTGVLGGLIGNNYTKVNTGVPFLKDVPVIGSAFQSNRVTGSRTELLLLITPYIVRNDDDMADFADRYASDMNAAFRTGRGWSYTLTPWSISPRFRGLGFDLPSPSPASETPTLLPRRGGSDSAVSAPPVPVDPVPTGPVSAAPAPAATPDTPGT